MEIEVETSRVKTLERITVAGLHSTGRERDIIVNAVLYNGEYYCIDDPIILEGKEKVKVRVVGEVSSEEDLYAEYISHNTRNILNPYQLLLLYRKRRIRLPTEVQAVLERNITIRDSLLTKLNEHLLAVERKHKGKVIFISFVALDAISIAESEYVEKGLAVEEVIRCIDELVNVSDTAVHYPSPHAILAYLEGLFAEEKAEEEREKEREHIAELKRQLLKDAVAKLYNLTVSKPLVTTAEGGKAVESMEPERLEKELQRIATDIVTDSKDRKGITRIKIILLNYSADSETAEKHIQRELRKFINALRRYGVTVEINEQANR